MHARSTTWILVGFACALVHCVSNADASVTNELPATSAGGEASGARSSISSSLQRARAQQLARCEETEEALAARAGQSIDHNRPRTWERRRMNDVSRGLSPDVDAYHNASAVPPPANAPSDNRTHLNVELETLRLAMDAVADARTDRDVTTAMQALEPQCTTR